MKFTTNGQDLILIAFVSSALLASFIYPPSWPLLLIVSIIGTIPTVTDSFTAAIKRKITIDTFNSLALLVSLITGNYPSTAFIILMLTFARMLDRHTSGRANRAIEEILRLRPQTALKEIKGELVEIKTDEIKAGDIIAIKSGMRIAVDGIVIYGSGLVNESLLTGESQLIEKTIGDEVSSSTLNESGVIKIRATRVGKDSTVEQIAELVRMAGLNKSKPEKIADRFAQIFLPAIALLGLLTYLITRNVQMVTALFLVACADDMAVSIPLAITAALGQAARRGVIIKGGEWLDKLSKVNIIVLDKTGTLTYGNLAVARVIISPEVPEEKFWKLVAIAEKYSEHPAGRAISHRAVSKVKEIPDPDHIQILKGQGVIAKIGSDEVIIGNKSILDDNKIIPDPEAIRIIGREQVQYGQTTLMVYFNRKFAGLITLTDEPRAEAPAALKALTESGVSRILMFTGDNAIIAKQIAERLGITEVMASMQPADKLKEIELLLKQGTVAMIGDGVNDAPSLARADVGIAMGHGGSAVAIEAADVILLTDNLERLPEMIRLSRRAQNVINGDMAIWGVSNIVGFALVFTGIAGPAIAAFYNFATDFLPLLNSVRLFRNKSNKK